MRWIFWIGLILFGLGILAQGLLAGRGIFEISTFELHAAVGFILGHGVALLLLIVSFLTRIGWRMHILAAVTFVVAMVLPILPTVGATAASLHPMVALILLGLVVFLVTKVGPLVLHPRPDGGRPPLAPHATPMRQAPPPPPRPPMPPTRP